VTFIYYRQLNYSSNSSCSTNVHGIDGRIKWADQNEGHSWTAIQEILNHTHIEKYDIH